MKKIFVTMAILLSAMCVSCGSDNYIDSTPSKLSKGLTIKPSETKIQVGEEITFTVVDTDGKPVDNFRVIGENGKKLTNDKFTATEVGTFKFYATRAGYTNSEKVEIHVTAKGQGDDGSGDSPGEAVLDQLTIEGVPSNVKVGEQIPIKVLSNNVELDRADYEIYDKNNSDLPLEVTESGIVFDVAGEYDIFAKSKEGKYSDSESINITVNEADAIQLSLTLTPATANENEEISVVVKAGDKVITDYKLYETRDPSTPLPVNDGKIKFSQAGTYGIIAKSDNPNYLESEKVQIVIKPIEAVVDPVIIGESWPNIGIYNNPFFSYFNVIDQSTIKIDKFSDYTLHLAKRDVANKKYYFTAVKDGTSEPGDYTNFTILFMEISENLIKIKIIEHDHSISEEEFLTNTFENISPIIYTK